MELIASHRETVDFCYAPPGETDTIYTFLKKYDVIDHPNEIRATGDEPKAAEATKKHHGSRIGGPAQPQEEREWLVKVDGQSSEQVEDFIRI